MRDERYVHDARVTKSCVDTARATSDAAAVVMASARRATA
jgi:hypothetical protein